MLVSAMMFVQFLQVDGLRASSKSLALLTEALRQLSMTLADFRSTSLCSASKLSILSLTGKKGKNCLV